MDIEKTVKRKKLYCFVVKNEVFDVGIIGGGVIGLSCAWRLAQAGARVAVFERGTVGREASWAAAGMLAAQCEAAHHPPAVEGTDEYSKRQTMFDLCLESRAMYSQFAGELFDATNIDIELSIQNYRRNDWRTPGILYVQTRDEDVAFSNFAQQKIDSLAVENTAHFNDFPATWLPDEGQVNNRVLVKALQLVSEQIGVTIYENESVSQVLKDADGAHQIETSRRRASCEKTLFCGGARSALHLDLPHNFASCVKPIAGQMIALRTPQPLTKIIYASDVYIVPRRDGRVLVGATMEDVGFDATVTSVAAEQLFEKAKRLIPELEQNAIEDQWVGLRPQTSDGLPILSRTENDHFYVATGHFRNGILLAPVTAKLMTDCVLNDIEPPREFSIERFQNIEEHEPTFAN